MFVEGGDTINPITIPTTLASASSGTGAAKAPSASGARGAFASLFAGKLTAATASTTSGPTPTVDAELVRSVKEQLDGGTSLSDLAARLASSVAAQLGISPHEAQQRLTQAFTKALQPNDTGPPRSNAERASSLVSRLRQIAELATGVTNGDTGHTIRLIAGQRSDADQAKAKTAPTADTVLRDALAALAAPTSPLPGAPDPSAVPAVSAAASDGRTVALDTPAQAIATGGDTPLGRILTRAVLAGDQRPADGPLAGSGKGGDASSGFAKAISQTTAQLAAANGGTTAPGGTDAVDAFVQAFASALARADGNGGNASRDLAATAPAARALDDAAPSVPLTQTTPPVPFALPFAHDAAPVTPPVPSPSLPQAQHVDANAVVDQLLRGVQIRTTDGQSEVRLRLVPENLGDVSVKLIVTGGSVDASIVAHTADAQSALAGGAAQLAKTLADAGLKLQSFTVGLAGGFADARDQSRPNDSGNRSGTRRFGGVRAIGEAEPDDDALLAAPMFGPSIYSPSRAPWALEYLA